MFYSPFSLFWFVICVVFFVTIGLKDDHKKGKQ